MTFILNTLLPPYNSCYLIILNTLLLPYNSCYLIWSYLTRCYLNTIHFILSYLTPLVLNFTLVTGVSWNTSSHSISLHCHKSTNIFGWRRGSWRIQTHHFPPFCWCFHPSHAAIVTHFTPCDFFSSRTNGLNVLFGDIYIVLLDVSFASFMWKWSNKTPPKCNSYVTMWSWFYVGAHRDSYVCT